MSKDGECVCIYILEKWMGILRLLFVVFQVKRQSNPKVSNPEMIDAVMMTTTFFFLFNLWLDPRSESN